MGIPCQQGVDGHWRSQRARKFLETEEGYKVPGELVSMEISGSEAPMLLSLQAQQGLGQVIDMMAGTVYSKTLSHSRQEEQAHRDDVAPARFLG